MDILTIITEAGGNNDHRLSLDVPFNREIIGGDYKTVGLIVSWARLSGVDS